MNKELEVINLPLTEYNKEVSKSFQTQEETFIYFTIYIIFNISMG